MAIEKQILANLRNAAKSTGPRTPQGKAVFSNNAVKFGLQTLALIPAEDEAAYQGLGTWYYSYCQPVGPAERFLVDQMIRCHSWLHQRALPVETHLLAGTTKADEKGGITSKANGKGGIINELIRG